MDDSQDPALRRESFAVQTVDQHRIAFDWWHPDTGPRQSAVIVCHGFFKSKQAGIFQRISRWLARDYDVITMDFRGHGASSGWFTFSAREQADLDAVLDWAAPRYARLSVIGFSMGAAVAINTAVQRREIRSVVAVSAPSSFRDVEAKFWTWGAIRGGIEGLGRGSGCRFWNPFLRKRRPVDSIRQLAIPVLLIHGTKDMIISDRHSRRLFDAAQGVKQLEIISGGSHAEGLFRHYPETFCRVVEEWFALTLGPDSA
jgi:pimeloyl-ACP methyl ester carboxylesterase